MGDSQQTDRATPRIPESYATPEEAVIVGDKYIAAVRGYKELKTAPEVSAAVDSWATDNQALRDNLKAQETKRAELAQLETDAKPLLRRWNGRRRVLLSAVAAHADGSKDVVAACGFENAQRARAARATVPRDLRPKKTRGARVAGIRWAPTPGAQGYLLQYASDPEDQATYSAEIACKAARYDLLNQAPGTYLHFRVLALDAHLPSGKTAYSDWVAVLVRE